MNNLTQENNKSAIPTVAKSRNPAVNRMIMISILIIAAFFSWLVFGNHNWIHLGAEKKNQIQLANVDQSQADENLSQYNQNLIKQQLQHHQQVLNNPKKNIEKTLASMMVDRIDADPKIFVSHDFDNNREMNISKTSESTTKLFIGNDQNSQLFNGAQVDQSVIQATIIAHPDYTIVAGTKIEASIDNALDSELPGMITAHVSRPVYAFQGKRILIPAGSQLNGQYLSQAAQGQARLFIIWTRIILPNNTSILLDSPGSDRLGRAGIGADDINHHFFERFGMASLLSVIGAATSAAGVNSGDQYNSKAAYRQAIGQSFQQSAQSSLQTQMNIKPTLTVFHGQKIIVQVAHDLSFYGVLH